MAKVGDKYILHSSNGMDYKINVVNVNDFREPSMKYGIDMYDENGNYAGDILFVDDAFLNQCEKVGLNGKNYMDFLNELDAETLKAELLVFLNDKEISIDSIEDFKEQFIGFIEEDFSYGDCE